MLWSCRWSLDWGVKWSESCSVVSDSLRFHGQYSPWDSPCQITGVGSLPRAPHRGSSQPRNQTQVSCIAGGFFTSWATREAHLIHRKSRLFLVLHRKLMNADNTKQTNKNQITHHMFTIAYVFASHILIGTFNKWICMHLHKCIWVS